MIPDNDAVIAMLVEYYRDLTQATKEPSAGRHEELTVNYRVLLGRYLSRVLGIDTMETIFYCVGYQTPHFWSEYDPREMNFFKRCDQHPERRRSE